MTRTSYPLQHDFPEIASLTVIVTELDSLADKFGSKYTYNSKNLPLFHECRNQGCKHGGISFDKFLKKMRIDKTTEVAVIIPCGGQITSPAGRKVYGRCEKYFRIEITIELKESLERP